MTQIVTVNVSQTIAPAPNTLQKKGAMVTQGGTSTAPGVETQLFAAGDLTAILEPPKAITSLVWDTGVVTATTQAPHGIPNGKTISATIATAAPAGYNGTFDITSTGASAFTYELGSNPGAETSPGTYVPAAAAELLAMVTTFFAQGRNQSVTVLELGIEESSAGPDALDAFIVENPNEFYSYLVPRAFAAQASMATVARKYTDTTAKTYFWVTCTSINYSDFAGIKSVNAMVEAPGIPATELSHAADFYVGLNYSPSSTNRVTPMTYSYLFGVTPYPTKGNAALLAALKAAGVNVVSSGAEGQISNTILTYGTMMDLKPFNYWYSVDWAQINLQANVAAAIINGSNNPQNPLYLSQDGVNRLQAVQASTMSTGVSVGLVLGTPVQTALDQALLNQQVNDGLFPNQTVVNAIPFQQYYAQNPGDYSIGKYGGFSVEYTPLRGFDSVVINVNVTDFVNG